MDIFYNDVSTCDVEIYGVLFHKCLLIKYEYFTKIFDQKQTLDEHDQKQTLDEFEIIEIDSRKSNIRKIELLEKFSIDCIKEFKRYVYEQPINELTPILSIEIYKLSKLLDIKMFLNYRNKIQILLKKSNSSDMLYMLRNISGLTVPLEFTIESVDILDKNSPAELNLIAYCYQKGTGCAKDEEKALKLYEQNWNENKNSNSLSNLAYCYYNGIGCVENRSTALKLYEQSWNENKNINSLHNLATCYKYYIDGKKDENKAFELYEKNWNENKSADSLYGLAMCYELGIGCETDRMKAFELSKKNWEENNHAKSKILYERIFNGDGHIPYNPYIGSYVNTSIYNTGYIGTAGYGYSGYYINR